MRNLLLLLAMGIIGCNTGTPEKRSGISPAASIYNYDTLQGIYSGDFGGSNIRIVLTHVTGMHATGYNLHKGLRRNISGRMQQAGSAFTFWMNEPGDHQFDGKFTFTIDTATFVLAGNWTPLNDKSVGSKAFTLKKEIDSNGFAYSFVMSWSDSTGSLNFYKNGSCVFEYYPKVNGRDAEQLVRVKGTWSLADSDYTVDWQPNTTFPSRRSKFLLRTSTDSFLYGSQVLLGEGRALYEEGP